MPWLVTIGAPLLSAPLAVLALIWLSLALGRRILRWVGVPREGPLADRVVLAAALGMGALEIVPIALGAVGVLGVGSLRWAIGLVALVALPDLWAVASRARTALQGLPRPEPWIRWWAIALVPGLLVTALLAVTPAIDPDGLGYHLTVPKRWLEMGTLGFLPTYPNSNMPMGVEMLFTIALAVAGDAAAKLLHFSLGGLGAIGLYLAGQLLRSKTVGAVAVTRYLFGPAGVASLLGWAYLEGVTSFATIASALAWLGWFRRREVGWLRCAFLLAGLGVSFKITAGLFPIALLALTLVVQWAEVRERGQSLSLPPREIWSLAPLAILPVTPWLVRAALVTGNPLYPMFARWIPSRDLSPELANRWEHFNRYMNWAIQIGGHWSLQRRQLTLVAVAVVIAALGLLVRRRLDSRLKRGAALVLLGTVLVQLGAVGLYIRYWIPLLSVLQLPVIALFDKFLVRRGAQIAVVAATAVASLAQVRKNLAETGNDVAGLVRTAVGLEDQRTFLGRHIPLFPIYEYANQTLPADARILLSCYCGGFHLDRSTLCADIVQGSLRMTNWDDFVADLNQQRVTHVLAPRTLAEGGPLPPTDMASVALMVRDQEYEFVGRLLAGHGRLLVSASDQGLYAIDLSVRR